SAIGRAAAIADGLIASGRARPCLLAMPDAHAVPATADSRGQYDSARNAAAVEGDLLGDVLPLVESRYRTRNETDDRALAGLSMGGALSLRIGFAHPERFGWLASMSGGSVDPQLLLGRLSPEVANRRLRLLWIGCGRGDDLVEGNRALVAQLAAHGIH